MGEISANGELSTRLCAAKNLKCLGQARPPRYDPSRPRPKRTAPDRRSATALLAQAPPKPSFSPVEEESEEEEMQQEVQCIDFALIST